MFTKQELQVVIKTLAHRRDWLIKSLESADTDDNSSHKQTLQLIETALGKLNTLDIPSVTARETASVSAAAYRGQLEPAKIRVLIVDDDTQITTLISTYLIGMGIEKIHIAEDGLRAITMLYDAKPIYDLVLCDWSMPIKSGLEVHSAMRASERYQNSCFMLVTAITEAKQIRAAIEGGVDDYVVKPIDQAILTKKIARLFPQVALP